MNAPVKPYKVPINPASKNQSVQPVGMPNPRMALRVNETPKGTGVAYMP
jgi:hypothetical protein